MNQDKKNNLYPGTNRVVILNVPFDPVTLEEAYQQMCNALNAETPNSSPLFIATPNPEMLLEARHNEPFKKLLQQTSLNVPDGAGILWAAKRQNTPLPQRVTGTDLMQKFCQTPPAGAKIFLLGATPGVAEKVAEKFEEKTSSTLFTGTFSGSPKPEDEKQIIDKINQSGANTLFVAFGAPQQELWLQRNLPNLPHIKVAMGVGGAFDFLSGTKRRAPLFMQKLHLEWLFRLILEPSRIKRIWSATLVFPLTILKRSTTHIHDLT